MLLTKAKQRADPKSYKTNVTAEVINSLGNKRLDSPKENIYIMSYF